MFFRKPEPELPTLSEKASLTQFLANSYEFKKLKEHEYIKEISNLISLINSCTTFSDVHFWVTRDDRYSSSILGQIQKVNEKFDTYLFSFFSEEYNALYYLDSFKNSLEKEMVRLNYSCSLK